MATALTAPAELDASGKKLWRDTRAALVAQGTWKDHDASLLTDYCAAKQRARRARAKLSKTEMTTTGSTGQDVPHPLIRIVREAESDALDFARELLITPRSRGRAGVASKPPAGGAFAGAFDD